MKIKKKDFDIFNLSFLDVISCCFGAVVLLVLISKTDRDTPQSSADQVESLLEQVMTLKSQVDNLAQQIDQKMKMNDIQLVEKGNLGRTAQTFSQDLSKKRT